MICQYFSTLYSALQQGCWYCWSSQLYSTRWFVESDPAANSCQLITLQSGLITPGHLHNTWPEWTQVKQATASTWVSLVFTTTTTIWRLLDARDQLLISCKDNFKISKHFTVPHYTFHYFHKNTHILAVARLVNSDCVARSLHRIYVIQNMQCSCRSMYNIDCSSIRYILVYFCSFLVTEYYCFSSCSLATLSAIWRVYDCCN